MVYIDALIDYGWKLGPSCHLLADTEEELHKFAASIGMKRAWFQTSKKGIPHYDLTANKRKIAVAKGAKEITRNEMAEKVSKYLNL